MNDAEQKKYDKATALMYIYHALKLSAPESRPEWNKENTFFILDGKQWKVDLKLVGAVKTEE